MKKLRHIIAFLMFASLLLAVMPMGAAAAESYNVNGTVGEYLKFVFFNDDQDIVENTEHTGNIPGVNIIFPRDGQVAIAGTPTKAGTYVMEITVYTQRTNGYNIVLTVTIQDKAADGTPVVTKNPTGESVVEGESAIFIARADNVRQYCWQIGIADASIDAKDLPSYLGKGVKVSGWNSEQLVIENIPKELDNAHIWCRFVGAEESVNSSAAVLKVTAKKDATPVITKHPTSETVEEGGEAIFIAKAKYTQIYTWQLISPEGIIFDCDTVHLTFPNLKVTGAKTEKIVLSNIPLELNGYQIRCMFTGGDAVVSNSAKLTVTAKPEEKPTEAPTEQATEAPSEPTKAPETQPATEKTENNNQDDALQQTTTGSTEIPEKNSPNRTMLIALIISVAAVSIAGITAFTLLMLKKPDRR